MLLLLALQVMQPMQPPPPGTYWAMRPQDVAATLNAQTAQVVLPYEAQKSGIDTGTAAKVLERTEEEKQFQTECFALVKKFIDKKRFSEAAKVRPIC